MRDLRSLSIRRRTSPRAGAAAVESAMILTAFLTLVLGTLDYGLAVLNRNNLEAAACRLARAASVRGEKSASAFDPWGPATFQGTAHDGSNVAAEVAPLIAVMPRQQVRILLEWPEGSHSVGKPVRATLMYDHHSLLGGLLGHSSWALQAESVMRIHH